jgi:hypothetical protein
MHTRRDGFKKSVEGVFDVFVVVATLPPSRIFLNDLLFGRSYS